MLVGGQGQEPLGGHVWHIRELEGGPCELPDSSLQLRLLL